MDKLLVLTTFVATVRCDGYSASGLNPGVATASVTRPVEGECAGASGRP
ncbi:hypothetical protein [Metapseudomonas boanensis]|uniref:Uncharacterized protein n=1 Tax=Metapseudomonas boanensis TaxID=2822138 RepID=A0ABS5XCE5_9GAMM|nr:hypothetical protein [Pseudomonas boanensis]MBT8765370.1 hypothetical protein [Pseudomonas boanensis]